MADCSPKKCVPWMKLRTQELVVNLSWKEEAGTCRDWRPSTRESHVRRNSGLRVGLDHTSHLDRRQTRARREVRYSVCHNGIGKLPAGC